MSRSFFPPSDPINSPRRQQVNPDSADLVAAILGGDNSSPGIDVIEFGTTIVTATGSETRHSVSALNAPAWGPNPFADVTIPWDTDWQIPPGSDGWVVVIDTDGTTTYELWKTTWDGTTLGCSWGAIVDSGRSGSLTPVKGKGTGSNISRLAGLIRAEEWTAGVIEHALVIGSDICNPSWVYPATDSDGKNLRGTGVTVPEGTLLRLNPAYVPEDDTSLRDFETIIARAMVDYGAYIVDNAAGLTIDAEYASDATSTFTGAAATAVGIDNDFKGTFNIPWADQLQVMGIAPVTRYKVMIDWADNGTFDGPDDAGDDVSGRVLARTPVQISYGRDQAQALAPVTPGAAAVELDNRSKDYSPDNSASPLADDLGPGRPILILRAERTNLVSNPSFEDGVDDWGVSNCTVAQADTVPVVGDHSAKVTIISTADHPRLESEFLRVVPGRTYTGSAYIRPGQAGDRSARVQIEFYDEDGTNVLDPDPLFIAIDAGVYTRLSGTSTAPADATKAKLSISWSTDDAVFGDIHNVDAAMVEEAGTLGEWFDGGTGPILSTNPGFETGTTRWTGEHGATIAQSSAEQYEGAFSVKLTPDGTTSEPELRGPFTQVTPGVAYRATAHIQSTNAKSVSCHIAWYDASETFLSGTDTDYVAAAAGVWETRDSGSHAAPSGATQAKARVVILGTAAATDTLYVDLAGLRGPSSWTGPDDASSSIVGNILYRGKLDDYQILPDTLLTTAQLSALDALAQFSTVILSTPVYQGLRTGEAVAAVLDAIGWPADKRDLDLGATLIPFWWEEGTDAFTALGKILDSEGPTALATVSPSGDFVFQDRHHRILTDTSTTSQATFSDSGDEPLFSAPLEYDIGWKSIINSVSFPVDQREIGGLAPIYTSEDMIHLAAGESTDVVIQADDPFVNAMVPVEDVDYVLSSGTIKLGLTRTSGQSTTLRIVAVTTTVIRGMQVRAMPVTVTSTVQVNAENSVSVARYGVRSYPNDAPWCNANDAAAVAELVLLRWADRRPTVTITLRTGANGDQTRMAQALGRDLSDRVTIVDARTGLDDDFYIEQIAHEIDGAGQFHTTSFGCEKASLYPDTPFQFDVSGHGFDDGVFVESGIDDPSSVFVFGHATQGKFGTGRFGH